MKRNIKTLFYTKAAQVLEEYTRQTTMNDPKLLRTSLNAHISALQDAQIFLLNTDFATSDETKLQDIDKLKFTLPFKTCYFEIAETSRALAVIVNKDGTTVGIRALLVSEILPATFHGRIFLDNSDLVLQFIVGNSQDEIHAKIIADTGADASVIAMANSANSAGIALINKLCEYIHNCNLGAERVFRAVEHKTKTLGRCVHRVDHIIRLAPKAYTSYPEPAFSREIDWDMRWWVRGHWRKLPAADILGKDRTGEYSVRGFTWVTEHLRGPEDAPIKKATYSLEGTCQH